MLLILLYHQIYHPSKPQTIALFKEHLNYLKDNFNIVKPGAPLAKDTLNVALTFDDAYFDFYQYIYPLLLAYNVPAILGIPTAFIPKYSTLDPKTRLAIQFPDGMSPTTQVKNPLCSWHEIKTMVDSGCVVPAAHGHQHLDMSLATTDIRAEAINSKQLLTEKLNVTINTFIYPYGRTSNKAHTFIRKHFTYALRIGSALNITWNSKSGLLYRVDGDRLWRKNAHITSALLYKLAGKRWLNLIRGK